MSSTLEKHPIILTFTIISSLSAGLALYGLSSSFISSDEVRLVVITLSLLIGFTISFFLQRMFVRGGMVKTVLSISTILSVTYALNSGLLYDQLIDTTYSKVDSRYEKYSERYNEIKLLDPSTLTNTVAGLTRKINNLNNDKIRLTQNLKTELRVKIDDVAKTYLSKKKSGGYNAWWSTESSKSNCGHIGNNRVGRITCLATYNLGLENGEIGELDTRLSILKNDLKIKVSELTILKGKNSKNSLELQNLKNKINTIKNRAKDDVTSPYLIALILWIIGLFIELMVAVPMLKNRMDKQAVIKEEDEVKQVAKVEKEKLAEELRATINDDNKITNIVDTNVLNYLIDFANGKGDNKSVRMATWQKGRHCGRPIAIANSLIGAILYAVGNEHITSFSMLNTSNILEVNGKVGRKVELLETFKIAINEIEIPTLGSTSRALKINKKVYNPQNEALEFLINKEKKYGLQFNPNMINVGMIDKLLYEFLLKYYPTIKNIG